MALTAIAGTTKATSQKSARQRSFSAKENVADATAVALPSDSLKSIELDVEGVNDNNAFGASTMGQKVTGKLIIYAGDTNIRKFCHELVTKDIKAVTLTTNSGMSYAFASADTTPVLTFAYGKSNLSMADDKPVIIELLIEGYRDNLQID